MQPSGNLVADTICRTAEIGLTITGAADAGTLTGSDPLMVDTLKPAFRWGSEVPFHHATQDLHRAVQA